MTLRNSLRNLVAFGSLALLLGGCANQTLYGGQYWERKDMSDAAWQNGPKAQTMMNRDISRCLTDLKEEQHTSNLRNALPDGPNPNAANADEKDLADWNDPTHDGALLAEHTDYHDFDGCMNEKGWQRVDTIPYDVAGQARENYYKANVNYGSDPARKRAEEKATQTTYSTLND